MILPHGSPATLAAKNVNGFLSSILAWLQGVSSTSGAPQFPGFQVYPADWVLEDFTAPATCKTALLQTVTCEDAVRTFTNEQYRDSLADKTQMAQVCHADCGKSLATWVSNVGSVCKVFNISEADPVLMGGRMWAGYNETCLVDPAKPGVYCNGKQSPIPFPLSAQQSGVKPNKFSSNAELADFGTN